MVPEVRQRYLAEFSAGRYQELLRWLEAEGGSPVDFRVSETPVFLPAALARELEAAAGEIFGEVTSAEHRRRAAEALPARFAVPGETAHPAFVQIDFALARDAEGGVLPQLIELQGFPSLYGFQWLLGRGYRRHLFVPPDWTSYFSGHDDESYVARLRELIVGPCDPAEVVLLEIFPERQKTRIDFAVTERLLGVPTVCATQVTRRGRRLFYRSDRRDRHGELGGREVEIRRIYNRVIFDELERRGVRLDHLFRGEIAAEWVGHPNWYFRISKHSLPLVRSRYAPPCHFLADLETWPPDLDAYVLKPIFSFAGLGVDVEVTAEKLAAIADRGNYILQRKVEYAPLVATPDVPAKVEIRMMLLWGERPLLVNSLVRMSKGKMMGVDFNKDKTWIGASVAFHPPV
jgi:hypothetical protein